MSFAPESWRTQHLSSKTLSRQTPTSAQPSSRIDSPPKMPLTVQEPRTPTSIPFDSKAAIDVEYVPMPHRSGAEAQQGPHLLGNRLLIAVWNALDRLFETLEARINGRRAPLRLPRWRNRLRTASFSLVSAPMPVKAQSLALFLAGGSADMTGWSCPRVLLTQQPHHDLRRCRIMIYAARAYRCWTYPMGTSTRSTDRRR